MLLTAITNAQQMLFFTVVLLLLLPAFATAGHAVCSWKPGDLTPDHYGFTLYCRGTLNKINDTAITYSCGRTGREMASWGMLAPDKLEFNTPCGKDGFALHNLPFGKTKCYHALWSYCVLGTGAPADNFNCKYMNAWDDCEWDTPLKLDDAPGFIDVWAHD